MHNLQAFLFYSGGVEQYHTGRKGNLCPHKTFLFLQNEARKVYNCKAEMDTSLQQVLALEKLPVGSGGQGSQQEVISFTLAKQHLHMYHLYLIFASGIK